MNRLASALIDAAAFLELSGDDVVDPDAAVAAMEQLAAELQRCTAAERAALESTLASKRAGERSGANRPKVVRFYRTFLKDIALPRRRNPKPAPARTAKAKRPGKREWWSAVEKGRTADVARYLDADAKLVHVRSPEGIPALHWAAHAGDIDTVRLLVDRGADVNALYFNGENALHWAALGNSLGHRKAAELLIAQGAKTSAKNADAETPRDKAKAHGKNAVLLRAMARRRR